MDKELASVGVPLPRVSEFLQHLYRAAVDSHTGACVPAACPQCVCRGIAASVHH
jgi:hypothetical protein